MGEEKIISALDVIKSMEICKSASYKCDKCQYRANGCINALLSHAIIIIKGQKVDIEVLNERCESLSYEYRNHYESEFETEKETIRIEAIKDFAKRIKNYYGVDCRDYIEDESLHFSRYLDNLIKEMTEEKKCK